VQRPRVLTNRADPNPQRGRPDRVQRDTGPGERQVGRAGVGQQAADDHHVQCGVEQCGVEAETVGVAADLVG
jgi:hypothetical protein